MSKKILTNDWAKYLDKEFSQDYYVNLRRFLKEEYRTKVTYPHMDDVFNALHYTAFADVKVVILGQDPYHGPNQAHGLSFSVMPEVKVPPSLVNIFKELQDDVQITPPNHGYLLDWAKQGVLLLNTVLTVRAGEAHSHRGIGWETFTDQVIKTLNQKSHPIVYILWGAAAQRKHVLINTKKHHIIKAPHPSPLSAYRGFFGSRPFSKTNSLLENDNLLPINWQIT